MDARPFLVFFTLCAVAAPWSALRRHADEVQTLEAIMDGDDDDVCDGISVEEESSKRKKGNGCARVLIVARY